MKTPRKTAIISMISAWILLLSCCAGLIQPAQAEEEQDFTDVVVLSTTDMHGKCWETNLLTDSRETANMLRVSEAVHEFREEYGPENVILVDNGDLFQGTPVSEMQLLDLVLGESDKPPVMALCLKEIGYDAFVLGNHEFNFPWSLMRGIYDYLEDNGVNVLAANVYYDGTDGEHEEGSNVFTPYRIREITVDGHPHKIGILGFENTDITRWDLPINYPGMRFVSSDNDSFAIAQEAAVYIPKMQEAGCEFIIVSYHGGLGEATRELVFGENTQNQGLRLIEGTEGLGLVILGHDHAIGYSGSAYPDKSGVMVPVVNGGGQELTKTVFRFSEDAEGNLTWDLLENENQSLEHFDVDEDLQEKVRPYADLAMEALEKPIGTAAGDWDQSTDYYLSQNDTIDLIHLAQLDIPTKRLQEQYGADASAAGVEGLDHLDVDLSITSVVVNGNYVVKPGDISTNDIYRMYRFSNNLLVLPLSGRQIRAIMEENIAAHITTRVYRGGVHNFTNGDNSTYFVFGGLNFTCDMAKPEGERVIIRDFSNGRPFDEDQIYLVAVSNYLLGNERCGLRDYGTQDAIWSQLSENDDETVQDLIAEYIEERCEEEGTITPDDVTWEWSLSYSSDPNQLPEVEGEIAARQVLRPAEGSTYVIYHEASGNILTEEDDNSGLRAAACEACGDALMAPLAQEALQFTVREEDDGFLMQSMDGRYLSCSSGVLFLTEEPSEDDLSLWELQPADGGWYIVSVGGSNGKGTPLALEYYFGRFSTYSLNGTGINIFNFYEIQ